MIDAREFIAGRRTGIGRFLEGLLLAMSQSHPEWRLTLAMHKACALPRSLESRADVLYLPHLTEWWWPRLAQGYDLFLSPYPKLPLRSLPCPSVHTVHDVLYLTHPAYRGNALRVFLATARLQLALKLASLTWFDSDDSLVSCRKIGEPRHPNVRFPAIAEDFTPGDVKVDSPYFLYVGNGLPHKNVPLLLQAIRDVPARLVLVGVRQSGALLAGLDSAVRDRVDCPQAVDDRQLLELYRGATALLLPSTAEGYGYPPLEAMACATPAIVADIPVLRETTGGAAMLCGTGDVTGWHQAMNSLLQPAERQAWVAKGLAWVKPLQAPDGWNQHVADIESLIAGKRR